MAIPDLIGQRGQSLQRGLQIGSALRNAELLQQQQEQMQQQQAFQAQMQPLQLRQLEAQTAAMEQENTSKQVLQEMMLLSQLPEKEGKQLIPGFIDGHQGNEPILAAYRDLYTKTGKDYLSDILMGVSAFSGKPLPVEREKAPAKVLELEAAGFVRGTPEFEDAMKALIFKDTEGKTSLKASDIKGINKDITAFVEPWKEIYRAAKDLDRLGQVKSAPAQMAMVFKYMKALDPTSVVREAEYASARNTTGIPDRILNYYNKLVDGSLLNEKQVGEFVQVSKELANSRAEGVKTSVSNYLAPYGDIIDPKRKDAFMNRADIKLFDIPTSPNLLDITPAPEGEIDLSKYSLEELKKMREQGGGL